MNLDTPDDSKTRPLTRFENGEFRVVNDDVSIEQSLSISIHHLNEAHEFSNTLCSPRDKRDLAVGLMWSEGLVKNQSIATFNEFEISSSDSSVNVYIKPEIEVDLTANSRLQNSTPSCGWCGRTSVDEVMEMLNGKSSPESIKISHSTIANIVDDVRESQTTFSKTGGVHAAAVADKHGVIVYLREDVGRHNAVDKVIGACINDGVSAGDIGILSLSGRAGIELVHKAAMASIEIIIAVGAPTTLAIDVARSANITLVGFVKHNSMNIYTHPQRIKDND